MTGSRARGARREPRAVHRGVLVAALLLAGCDGCEGCGDRSSSSGASPTASGPPQTLPLNPMDITRIAKQRKIIKTALRAHHGVELEGAPADLPRLQKLIDEEIFKRDELYERQGIAVTFGDAIAKELSLRWVMVLHQHGTEPALCCRPDGTAIDVLAMVADPLQRGEKVDLAAVKEIIAAQAR